MIVRGYHFALAVALACTTAALAACDHKRSDHAEAPSVRLDLNRATAADLERLPGIGPKHARSIIASRNARGGKFNRIEDLLEIEGIGPKTVASIRQYVEVP